MSYNPAVHGKGGKKAAAKRRQTDPRAGKRHSDYTRGHGPRGMNLEDMRNRQSTPHGWRILYFEGDQFEVYYEYFCARNGTGVIKSEDHDRVVRVLAGSLFVTRDTEIIALQNGQAMAFAKGEEYELSTSVDTDAELLVCQGPKYLDSIENLTNPLSNAVAVLPSPNAAPPRTERVDPSKAKEQAEKMKAERIAQRDKRNPVPGKKVQNELGEDVPPPSHRRAPLPGQTVTGASPMPVGAGGYSKE